MKVASKQQRACFDGAESAARICQVDTLGIWRSEVLRPGTVRIGVEAAIRQGWEPLIGTEGLFIGMAGFGVVGGLGHACLPQIRARTVAAGARLGKGASPMLFHFPNAQDHGPQSKKGRAKRPAFECLWVPVR